MKGPIDPVEGPHFHHLVSVALKWLREEARVCPLGSDWVRVQAGVLPCAGEGRQQGRSRNDPRSCLICVFRPFRELRAFRSGRGAAGDFSPGVPEPAADRGSRVPAKPQNKVCQMR